MKRTIESLTDADKERIIEHTLQIRRKVLPAGWRVFQEMGNCTVYLGGSLRVFVEVELQERNAWIHLSVSRRDRIPSYMELCEVKALFIGPERKAIQVFPRQSEHYNFHPNCLHLWSPIDSDPLPDFRNPTGQL